MSKNVLEGSIKDRIALMWDLHLLKKSQLKIAKQLKTNQKNVSHHLKVINVCGNEFFNRLPHDIKLDQLVRLASKCELEKEIGLDPKPATDFVKAVATGKTKFSTEALNAVAPLPRKKWQSQSLDSPRHAATVSGPPDADSRFGSCRQVSAAGATERGRLTTRRVAKSATLLR